MRKVTHQLVFLYKNEFLEQKPVDRETSSFCTKILIDLHGCSKLL